MKFKGDIIITDPCYVIKDEEWSDFLNIYWGKGWNPPKIEQIKWKNLSFLIRNTEYGDWGCGTFINDEKKECIGDFCADAGLVSVFSLKEVLEYDPTFDLYIKSPWTTTLIKDFDGEVNFKFTEEMGVQVIGEGNINFITCQTSL
jgi:hypothetical protein